VRVNHPPVPVISGTLTSETMTVTLSGTDSHDPDADGRIIRYEWTFGDGRTASGPTVTHTFERGDRHRVGLQVTDNSGTFSSRQRTSVEVQLNHRPVVRIPDPEPEVAPVVVPVRRNRPPVVHPVVPTEAAIRDRVLFDATGAEDPDGDTLTLIWLVNGIEVGRGSRLLHRFDEEGVYDITLIADDGTGMPNSFTRWVRTVHVYVP